MKFLKMLGLAAVAAAALMAFVGAGTASATTIAIGGAAQNSSVGITATLKSGTSAILKDEFGTTTDTCTESEVKGHTTEDKNAEKTITAGFSGVEVGGPVTSLTFKNCTHTTTVIATGKLWVKWISGQNGTVSSTGAEVTVQSTFFGASAVCKTGTGVDLGTATGTTDTTKHAQIDINATVNCGILGNAKWTGEYTVTSPTGFGVVN